MTKVDIAVIGAGAVGLSVALKAAERKGLTIVVLEKNHRFGQEISSRNSEVIHSGFYYSPEMLKSRLCVRGNPMLYEFLAPRPVSHGKIGKILSALDQKEEAELDRLYENALANQVSVRRLTKKQLEEMEPEIAGISGLYFPESGIINAHEYMQALYYEGQAAGVVYLFGTAVKAAIYNGLDYEIVTGQETIHAQQVINCAGLGAEEIAGMIGIDTEKQGYRLHPCKGEYFKVRRKLNIQHLIYSVPTVRSLGIHLSMDQGGGLRLGPNAFYVDELNYDVDESHAEEFFRAASRYIPALHETDLLPDFAGIRPKLQAPGEPMKDFIIQEEGRLGLPGWINLIGIESPGLTASLAIGEYVAAMLG
ncbi:MAG TPA: NAD(P)/FAD-dependent oxidoreductase [Syntrophomonadaceae bacterium]|nr:NAD(P)/FAD-dependent oxidoreductase [Syntrophomonadaceae bacterium]HRX21834.1 NAD(P)/FAD-dependent oxidoreductase [Syntrophomonadaceae bacterium]